MARDRALGEIVTIDFQEWLSPANPEQLFDGEIFLLVGQRTYSQAIVFATTFQDFGLGIAETHT